MMLDELIIWLKKYVDLSSSEIISLQIKKSETSSNSSIRIDIDTNKEVARLTFWESGDYAAEIIELESDEVIFINHGNVQGASDFSSKFSDFFSILGVDIFE